MPIGIKLLSRPGDAAGSLICLLRRARACSQRGIPQRSRAPSLAFEADAQVRPSMELKSPTIVIGLLTLSPLPLRGMMPGDGGLAKPPEANKSAANNFSNKLHTLLQTINCIEVAVRSRR